MQERVAYDTLVRMKYELFNSLFLTLPFPNLEEVGIKLPLFAERCRVDLEQGKSPAEIVEGFFQDIFKTDDEKKRLDVLFLFTQFIERQVVLFDALEQAAFSETHPRRPLEEAEPPEKYRTRIVLTAHPTQFYPEAILKIIDALADAVRKDELKELEEILLQLGMTSFRNKEQPTPLSEAAGLLDRVGKVFYEAILNLESEIASGRPAVELGFWPGGDRDGNPFVTVETTLEVASRLRENALSNYRRELDALKRRLTFPGMAEHLHRIEEKLASYETFEELLADLEALKALDVEKYRALFCEQIDRFCLAVRTFGFYFASLDLRQDSSVHEEAIGKLLTGYTHANPAEKAYMLEAQPTVKPENIPQDDFFDSLRAVPAIQKTNGVRGLHRYIISNTQAAHHVLEVNFALHILGLDRLDLDIVPLFETIDDLKRSESVMQRLYESPFYRERLKRQGNRQVVMVGFSDGTKDGGYLSCNWEIFKAKRGLEALSDRYGVEILFFDGRGGPPARGGGNTHRFYRALGSNLKQQEVQLTIQGQTISSMYGTEEAARFNLEQLYTAGLEAKLHPDPKGRFTAEEITLIDALSEKSLAAYGELRGDPLFLSFLQEKTPLEYYGKLNVASRPAKRGKSAKLQLKDLRAIPFVGAWSQIRLNVPGYYGLGTALEWGYAQGKGAELEQLYRDNLFFRTLIENCMQALAKSSALSTRYLLKDPTYGSFVNRLLQEMERTRAFVLQVSGQKALLESDPINKESIELREKLILPLLVIQQYALEKSGDAPYERLLLKTVPALINATRNSA